MFNNTIQFNRLYIYLFRKTQINTATYTLCCNYIHPLHLTNLYILSISRHIKRSYMKVLNIYCIN